MFHEFMAIQSCTYSLDLSFDWFKNFGGGERKIFTGKKIQNLSFPFFHLNCAKKNYFF